MRNKTKRLEAIERLIKIQSDQIVKMSKEISELKKNKKTEKKWEAVIYAPVKSPDGTITYTKATPENSKELADRIRAGMKNG